MLWETQKCVIRNTIRNTMRDYEENGLPQPINRLRNDKRTDCHGQSPRNDWIGMSVRA
jgi:hypothetical protein